VVLTNGARRGEKPLAMSEPVEPLIVDFLEWLAGGPKPYGEVMEAWRTSCPRLTVWEDAVDAGLVVRARDRAGAAVVSLTAAGRDRLSGRL
jgi:hypothetical protein